MATYTIFNFNDPSLNYSLVEATVNRMYSDLNANGYCCKSNTVSKEMSEVAVILQCIEIDRGDTIRYKADVKAAYKKLYTLV